VVFSSSLAPPTGVPPVGQMGMPNFTDARLDNEMPTDPDQPWPPTHFNPIMHDFRVWDAWWTGDVDKLMRAYYSLGANSSVGRQYFATTGEAGISAVRPGQYRGGLIGSVRRFFWLLRPADPSWREAHQLPHAPRR
jgi:hypothetical protein